MELIPNFDIDSFLRIIWVSKEAKSMWESALSRVNQLVQELEVLSVTHDQRPCSWQTISEDTLIDQTKHWEDQGLVAIPIKRVGPFEGFAHKHTPVRQDAINNVCVIVSKKYEDAKRYRVAFEKNDNVTQGLLLGFPECCCKFFEEMWAEGYYDPIWQAAINTVGNVEERFIHLRKGEVHPYSNSALRYVGLRLSFHINHSFNCKESIRIGEERIKLAEEVNPQVTTILKALLEMPFSWNVCHGIAVVRTPIFYIVTSSVPSKFQHVVEVDGDFIPKESSRGVTYPFTLVS